MKNSDLRSLLGDDWIREQAEIVRKHANEYQRKTWDSLLKGIREDPVAGTEAGSISRGALKVRLFLYVLITLPTSFLRVTYRKDSELVMNTLKTSTELKLNGLFLIPISVMNLKQQLWKEC